MKATGAPLGDKWLSDYMRKHPHLFPGEPLPSPAPEDPILTELKRQARLIRDNGFPTEALFQVSAKSALEAQGWTVQESLKGSSGGGAVWYGKGWPDLQAFREDGTRRTVYIELKQPGKVPTQDQMKCHAQLRRGGYTVAVAWTVEGCLNAARLEDERHFRAIG